MFGLSIAFLIVYLISAVCGLASLYYLSRALWLRWKIHKEDTRE